MDSRYLFGQSSADGADKNFAAGVYTFESGVNLDQYLEELGVSFFMRQLAAGIKPAVTIRPDESCRKVDRFIELNNSFF
jgi:hypothetical protein